MSEFIVIQVGQCGNQIGSALWPHILNEYNVSLHRTTAKSPNNCPSLKQNTLSSFFHIPNIKKTNNCTSIHDLINNKVRARAVCIDMEDSVVARYRTGPLKGLFDERCLVTNYPGSGNNWAEGFCDHGPQYKNKILRALKHAVERCDSLHGFLVLFSTGGGTGSGVGTYVLQLLADFYPKIERFVSCVYSTGTEDVITCPYNNALATKQLLENATCVFPVENRCLLDIVSRKHRTNFTCKGDYLSIFRPFEDMNSVVVEMLLHLTSGSRFSGTLNFDMNEINTNMIPYPQMKFLSSGFHHTAEGDIRNGKITSKQYKEEMFLTSCNRANQLIKVDPLAPKSVLLATTLIGRGDYTPTDLHSYTEKLQSKAKFTPWSKKSVKIGLCNVPPRNQNVSLFSLFNTTGMHSLFEHIYSQYNRLLTRKAHMHHYTKIENFEEDFFWDCSESLQNVMENYKELENMDPVKIPRLTPLKLG